MFFFGGEDQWFFLEINSDGGMKFESFFFSLKSYELTIEKPSKGMIFESCSSDGHASVLFL